MADNIAITAGTGTNVATDDISGAHYQRVKISDGTADSTTHLKIVAEDAQHTTGDTGIVAMAVRQDTAASLSGTDSDYNPLITDSSGRLHVNVGNTVTVGSHAVTNAGTFAVQVDGNALTALQLIDDTVATLGTSTYTETTTKGNVIGAVRRDADTTLVDTTNEIGPLQMDANGRLKVEAFSGETLPVSLTSTTVTGTVAVTQSGTWDEVGINDSGNSITVDNGGTFAVQATAVGTVADDGTTPGAPIMIGGVAVETDGTDPTSVSAEDDIARLRTDRNRLLLVNQTHPRHWHVSADYASAQTNASIKAAPGAGLSLYITDISISNGATAGNITLLDGSGGTVIYEIYPAINGGAVENRRNPIRLTANTALCITSTTVTTHSVNIGGYIAP